MSLVFLFDTTPKYQRQWIGGCLFFLTVFLFSVLYTQCFIVSGTPSPTLTQNDYTGFIASVIESPVKKTKTLKLLVRIQSYQDGSTFEKDGSKAVLYLERNKESEAIAYGDKLVFYSQLKTIPPPKNPCEFDYKRYLSIKNIHLQSYIKAGAWQRISQNKGSFILHLSKDIRNRLLNIFRDCNMDVREYGVVAAMLLGNSDELDPEVKHSYSVAGVSHILCVSGMHVGIIYLIISSFLRLFAKIRNRKILCSLILLSCVWLYACITGLAPSVMRAADMFSFVAVGDMLKRKTISYNSLLMSLFCLLLFNPLLLFEVGFQYSYLAVFGILWTQRPLNKIFRPRTKIGKFIWNIITVSFTAQLFTAPLSILYFHQFPNYFLLTNIVVITLAPLVIGLGITVLLFSVFPIFCFSYLSMGLMYLVKFMNWIIVHVEALPYAVTENISFSALQVVFIYLLIVLFFAAFLYRSKHFLFSALVCTMVVLGMDIYKQITVNNAQELIFYSLSSGYAIDCIENRHSTLVCDSNTYQSQKVYDYSIKNNHIYHRIAATEKRSGSDFVKFHDKTIFIMRQAVYAIPVEQKIKVDYLVLTNKVNIPLERLREMVDFKMILTDASYPSYRRERIQKACLANAIPYHDLKNQGSLIIKKAAFTP
jgi:competence protein ComEC